MIKHITIKSLAPTLQDILSLLDSHFSGHQILSQTLLVEVGVEAT